MRCFSYGDVEHRQSECKKLTKRVLIAETEEEEEAEVGDELQFDEGEDGGVNIRAEPIFDEEEVVQKELVDYIGAEPKFDEEEVVQEESVEVGEELQFDEDETANEDWVEDDVGALLMLRPASITVNEDFGPEIAEVEWPAAAKCDKEEALSEGNTAAEQGTTMVERPVCLTPRAAFATITNVDEQVVDENLRIKTEKHPTPYRLVCSVYLSKIRGRIFSNLERMVQQAKMIRQALGMVEMIRMVSLEGLVSPLELVSSKTWISPYQKGKFRGPFQRANELKINIIICFRKAQDEPYKCYEDSVFYNGPQNIRIWQFSLWRTKTAVSSFMVFNCCHDSVRLFYFLLVYM